MNPAYGIIGMDISLLQTARENNACDKAARKPIEATHEKEPNRLSGVSDDFGEK